MSLLLILLLLILTVTFGQSVSSIDIGDTTFKHLDKFSGSRQSTGKTDFYSQLQHWAELDYKHALIARRHEFLAAQR